MIYMPVTCVHEPVLFLKTVVLNKIKEIEVTIESNKPIIGDLYGEKVVVEDANREMKAKNLTKALSDLEALYPQFGYNNISEIHEAKIKELHARTSSYLKDLTCKNKQIDFKSLWDFRFTA